MHFLCSDCNSITLNYMGAQDCDPICQTNSEGCWGRTVTTFNSSLNASVSPLDLAQLNGSVAPLSPMLWKTGWSWNNYLHIVGTCTASVWSLTQITAWERLLCSSRLARLLFLLLFWLSGAKGEPWLLKIWYFPVLEPLKTCIFFVSHSFSRQRQHESSQAGDKYGGQSIAYGVNLKCSFG